jgi:hypothetical protein
MILIDNVLISDELVKEFFVCHLDKCKGACCWEGDFGAPLEPEEIEILDKIYTQIKSLLPQKNQKLIDEVGLTSYYAEPKYYGTSLMPNGACSFMIYDDKGIAKCSIEHAHEMGLIEQKKPISCHLYPVRATHNKESGFQALNYDRWDICAAACALGAKEKIPVYTFVKDAIIRKYGKDFYDQLEQVASTFL